MVRTLKDPFLWTYSYTDLFKLYQSVALDPDYSIKSLQEKVQFDIRFYFARRGAENMSEMQVDTFQLIYDADAKVKYVKKVKDEITKNHKDVDKEIITGFMPEIPGNSLCPVKSFEKYVSHLHPEGTSLWQAPIRNPPTNVWYGPKPTAQYRMKNFMQNLSKAAGLSRKYTNHDIRVTGCSILTRAKYTNKQISSISGHRSMESLAIYQRVSKDEKLHMGITLNCALLAPELIPSNPQLELPPSPKKPRIAITSASCSAEARSIENNTDEPPPPPPAIAFTIPKESTSDNQLVPFNSENTTAPVNEVPIDFDLLELLADTGKENQSNPANVVPTDVPVPNYSNTNTQINVKNSPKIPAFHNCQIGTINFNIIKK